MEGPDEVSNARPGGPAFLRSLCAFSAVNIILSGLFYLIGFITFLGIGQLPFEEFSAMMHARLEAFSAGAELPGLEEMIQLMYTNGAWLMLILFARTIVRGAGVYLMRKGKAKGFPVYAFAQITGIFAPHLVLPWAFLGIFGPLAAVGMTALYGSQRQWLN